MSTPRIAFIPPVLETASLPKVSVPKTPIIPSVEIPIIDMSGVNEATNKTRQLHANMEKTAQMGLYFEAKAKYCLYLETGGGDEEFGTNLVATLRKAAINLAERNLLDDEERQWFKDHDIRLAV